MIEKLRKEFLEVYFSNISSTKGLIDLAENIGISKNSLRRFVGKLKDDTRLRISTLNLIAEPLGYKNFQDFCETSEHKTITLDFDLLEIFYDAVKGKGTKLQEPGFQVVNYYFSKKIVENLSNLKEFSKRFSHNEEALELVIAYHPSYEKIANEEYQNILLHLAKNCKQEHIKVFANSFIYFGKFLSEKIEENEMHKIFNKLERNVRKMRNQSTEFYAFPEARYIVAKIIHQTVFPNFDDYKNQEIQLPIYNNTCISKEIININQIILDIYVSDCYNILQKYNEAIIILSKYRDEKQLLVLNTSHPFLKAHIHLLRINRGIALYHTGKKSEALLVFKSSSSYIHETKYYSFDSKIYFELKYYILGKHLFPSRADFQAKFTELIDRSGLTYLRNL